jgi:hypothetical protein
LTLRCHRGRACFQARPLAFASPARHTIRFANSSLDFEFPATVVESGGGQGWMRWPFPNYAGGAAAVASLLVGLFD